VGSEITAGRAGHPGGQGKSGVSGESRIQLLPDALIDQIAAGEVVERPASVVKELVENALDAGAGRIQVAVREGGNAWLAVQDDGHGMSPRDARAALQRHATSKLHTASDLERIRSFGFRGEALPAIASVSRLRLVTRAAGAEQGTEIRVEGGEIVVERSVGGAPGTRIEVADLFVNVPARRKFLKRPATEWGHIATWLERLALALPGVHLEIQREEHPPTTWPAASEPRDRIAAVLSGELAERLIHAVHEEESGHFEVFVSPPEFTRASAQGIYQFVNQRPVRDKVVQHALLSVYRDILPRGRFPAALVFLTVAPESVDVNVHPAKWEVRFAEPQAIHQGIRRAVQKAIAGQSWLGAGAGGQGRAQSRLAAAEAGATAGPGSDAHPQTPRTAQTPRTPQTGDWTLAERVAEPGSSSPEARAEIPVALERPRFRDCRLIGQLLASYLLVESKQGLLLVDQHAAHERVLYERLRASWQARQIEEQPLLAPSVVELGAEASAALLEQADLVARLGFAIEAFGEGAVAIRSVPALLADHDPAHLVRDLADELSAGEGRQGASELRLLQAADRTFATLACHSARRAGDHLEPAEQRTLIDALDTIPWAPTCPHGRPVVAALDQTEIEKRFARR